MTDLASLDATSLAELIRRRELSPLELVDDVVARIEKVNPRLNAVTFLQLERAREQARGVLPAGPFQGVPYLLKDVVAACTGMPLTAGSAMLRHHVCDHDSVLVSRLRAAGFVLLGRTSCCELGLLPTTEPKIYGPTRNPWDLSRTTGGSSGGSAAAVASRMLPAAHANDGGGSIRIPASCCGVFGLKPTRGRISLGPDYGDIMNGLVVEHAITRSVRDSAAILDATAGAAPGDPYVAPAPPRPFTDEIKLPAGRLRIAWSTTSPIGTPVHPSCKAAVEQTARLCEALGHMVREAAPVLSAELLLHSFMAVWAAGTAASVDSTAALRGAPVDRDELEPTTWALVEAGRQVTAPVYLMSVGTLQQASRQVARFFEDVDLWLTPTLAEPPVPLGTFQAPDTDPMAPVSRAFAFSPFTPLANITGQPAMSVPLALEDDRLPIGVHFLARHGDEGLLLRVALQLEAACPWNERLPPVHA
jgi:amidase